MLRKVRYQGAILQNGRILLVQHHSFADNRRYWIFPGGGQEPGESDEETVAREMREETGLEVRVERLLFETPWEGEGVYRAYRTYLCTPLSGEAAPGYEPEPEAASSYEIAQVGWVDIYDESTWSEDIRENIITAPVLRQVRAALNEERSA